jgi:hypothetical protein
MKAVRGQDGKNPLVNQGRQHAPNLLVLGASGNVARAFLRRLSRPRDQFGQLVLLDKGEHVLHDRFIEHQRLEYRFIRHRLAFPQDNSYYRQLLRRHRIGIVLDLTDIDTLPVLGATDAAGASYVCTSLNDTRLHVVDLVNTLHPSRHEPRHAPHILCSGMNPGVVNIWVHHAVRHYGVPREIIHFEYDNSTTIPWRPVLTWSRREFLTEAVWEPTGSVIDGRPHVLPTNSLENRQDLRSIMRPVDSTPTIPRGLLVLHEENLTQGRNLGVSSKFIYAIHPKTMAYLARCWRQRGRVRISDLEIGDNTARPLTGADTIGVCLDYLRRRVYYRHSLANGAVVGTNATCQQVTLGIFAALFTLVRHKLEPRIYFAGDLYGTLYRHVVLGNMHVEHFVFAKRKRSLVLRRHQPDLRDSYRRLGDLLI